MNEPSKEEKPQNRGENKLDQGREGASLHELAKTGNKEAANGREDIACAAGTGIRHNFFLD
jgi:hypothetical protein